VDTTRFAKAAAFCNKAARIWSGEDLARRGCAPDGKKHLRQFSIWEITRCLIPVASAHLRRVVRANPGLPQGEGRARARRALNGSRWKR
jgi:chromosome partitioning protein